MWKRPDSDSPASSPSQPGPATAGPSGRPAVSRHTVATIGPSITVKGDLSGEEDLVVEGKVEGTIKLHRNNVTVGKQGRVQADIHGRNITVEGHVEGNLFGEEQVVVRQSGEVRGNITAPRVSLEDGANFKGAIDMEPKPSPGRPAAGSGSGGTGGGSSKAPAAGPGSQGGSGSQTGSQAGSGAGSGSKPGSGAG